MCHSLWILDISDRPSGVARNRSGPMSIVKYSFGLAKAVSMSG